MKINPNVVRLDERKHKRGRFSQYKSSQWQNYWGQTRLTCPNVTDCGSINTTLVLNFLLHIYLSEKYCRSIFLKLAFSEYLIYQRTSVKVIFCDYKYGHSEFALKSVEIVPKQGWCNPKCSLGQGRRSSRSAFFLQEQCLRRRASGIFLGICILSFLIIHLCHLVNSQYTIASSLNQLPDLCHTLP